MMKRLSKEIVTNNRTYNIKYHLKSNMSGFLRIMIISPVRIQIHGIINYKTNLIDV